MARLPTDLEMVVLSLLERARGREMYGREMAVQDVRLKENSVYVLLGRMVTLGYLTARLETSSEKGTRGGPRRRLYKLTKLGRQRFERQSAQPRSLTAQRERRRPHPLSD
jgi:DNA-binding PadR family transcriptional regulator